MRLLLSLFLFSLFSLTSQGSENRIALLIGNSAYQYATPLSNPVNDIEAMSEMLNELGFEVMVYKDISQVDFKKAIDEFGNRLKSYDVGMFFYAGHGLQINGTNYLIPVDAKIDSEADVEYTCIDAGRVLAKMEASNSKSNIIILDACRNNPFKKSWDRSLKKEGLAFMEAPVGSVIAYSTSPGETASDGDSEHGMYTEALLKHIGDPRLNSLQVFQEVRKMVREKSNGKQVPWESTSLESDFYFNQSFGETEILPWAEQDDKTEDIPDRKDVIEGIEKIKNTKGYIWVEASGKTISEADNQAKGMIDRAMLDNIYSKIPVKAEAGDINLIVERNKSFCRETRNYVARRVYKKRKEYTVFRYIPLSELGKQLKYKSEKVASLYVSAKEAEQRLNMQDALKYYFWTYAMIANHPGGDILRQVESETEGIISMDAIEAKMETLFDDVNCIITDSSLYRDGYRYKVLFRLGDDVLRSIGFRYWNGVSWSDLNTTNNGQSLLDIYPGYTSKDIKINYEYRYNESARYDTYLFDIINSFSDNSIRTRSITVPEIAHADIAIQPELNAGKYQGIVRQFLASVEKGSPDGTEGLFSDEGLDIFKNLILYGNASTFLFDTAFSVYQSGDNTYIRGLAVKFDFPDSKTDFTENITLEITQEGLINNISFSLEDKAVEDILSKDRWPAQSKWELIRFLENYKTAYALKRIDYIDKIFSNRALIIVGKRVSESVSSDDDLYTLKDERFQMTKLSKEQYMYRLRRVFDRNEFINIKFEDNLVRKRDNTSNVYGINIKQNYYSSSYADVGYLFLMVDLKDNSKPVIYVRSWQPEKFSDGQVINLSDFTY